MPQKTKPSLLRIIQSDMLALIGIAIPVVMIILYVAITVFGSLPNTRGRAPLPSTAAPTFLYLSIAGVALGLPLAFWRICTIQQHFEHGEEVTGQIVEIGFFRDRGTVIYAYVYQNQKYTGSNSIMKTRQTQQLRPAMQVAIIVNPANPKQALIRDLYT